MIDLDPNDLALCRLLRGRKDNLSTSLYGLLLPILRDARAHLEFVRSVFPSYTEHGLQHSFRIIDKVGRILTDEAKRNLTSVEIFIFLLAAAFHDVGMVADDRTDANSVRRDHPRRSGEFFNRYLRERLSIISEHHHRLGAHLAFIVESHGMTWEEMVARPEFQRPETVMNQVVRSNVLAILLRIGDLLDLDSERSPTSLLKCTPGFFRDETSLLHHHRHQHVTSFLAETKEIRVTVQSHSREEHQLWSEWFSYLSQDILRANTYTFVGELEKFRLPPPKLTIDRAPTARYEMWPLRFEIDEGGKIWDIISKSIYTGRFDFVRELIQNAIDAELMWIFSDPQSQVVQPSPRSWSLKGYSPTVGIFFSPKRRFLRVIDNGIGMDKSALETFLFKVAETGYDKAKTERTFPFPSIAKFGIGFVSVLVRASRVVLDTTPRLRTLPYHGEGRRVLIKGGSRDAYVESLGRVETGTSVTLELRDDFTDDELINYLTSTFVYPSVPLLICNLDALADILGKADAEHIDYPENLRALAANTEADFQKYVDACAQVEALTATLRDRQKAAEKAARRAHTEAPTVPIGSTITRVNTVPLPKLDQVPVLLQLDRDFEIVEIKSLTARKTKWKTSSVLWVPVELDDLTRGIEWRSLHGFLVYKGELKSTIVFRGGSIVDEDEDLIDRLEDKRQELWLDGTDIADEDEDRSHSLDENSSSLRITVNQLQYAKTGPDEEPFSDFMEPPSGGFHIKDWVKQDKEDKDNELTIKYFELLSLYNVLSGTVFQDGIRIPAHAASIAPIGVCRARVNLTAQSRLSLNASRNAIDESPSLLDQWVSDSGLYIQRHIFDRVTDVFDKLGVHWKKKDFLFHDEKYSNQLLQHSIKGLRKILQAHGRKI